jgi:hypothetical protein
LWANTVSITAANPLTGEKKKTRSADDEPNDKRKSDDKPDSKEEKSDK